MFNPIRLFAALLGTLVLATPIAAVVFFFLAITGSPGACDAEERTVTSSFQLAADYEAKWDSMEALLDAGQAASATFSESEVTSRASVWLQEQDAPIDDIMICFGEGTAATSAKIDIPFVPGDVDVLARGSLILTGTVADSEITDLEVGGLPGPLTDLVEDFINSVIEDQTENLDLDHSYTLTFTDGQVTISGTP